MYFSSNKFTVFGVDLDDDSLVKAKASAAAHTPKFDDGKISFFNGKDTDMSVNGPYDAIFANSVLCNHGHKVSPQSIVTNYPFSDFEATLDYLDANLNVGGVLAIVNTNYYFSETQLSKKYKTLEQCSNFVSKIEVRYIDDVKYVAWERHTDVGMYDCVWIKEKK